MDKNKRQLPGELGLVIGALFDAFGVNMVIKADFGLSPVVSFQHMLYRVCPALSYGTWTYIMQAATLLFLILVVRKWRSHYAVAMVMSVLFGFLIDFYSWLCKAWPITLEWCIFYFIIGMITLAIGIGFFMICDMPLLPVELMMREMHSEKNIPVFMIKSSFDLTCIILALIMSMIKFGSIKDIGIGTIISALTLGIMTDSVQRMISRKIIFVGCLSRKRRLNYKWQEGRKVNVQDY